MSDQQYENTIAQLDDRIAELEATIAELKEPVTGLRVCDQCGMESRKPCCPGCPALLQATIQKMQEQAYSQMKIRWVDGVWVTMEPGQPYEEYSLEKNV